MRWAHEHPDDDALGHHFHTPPEGEPPMTYTRRTIVSPSATCSPRAPVAPRPAPPRHPRPGAPGPPGRHRHAARRRARAPHGRVGAAGALHVQPRPGHPDHPGGGVMRTVEQVVAEIDAAIAGTGPLSAHAWAPGREPPSNCWRAWAWPSPPPTPGARRRLAVRRRHHRHGGDPMTWDFHPTTPSTIWHASTARSMSVSAAPP